MSHDPGQFGADTHEDVTDWGQENIEINDRARRDRAPRLPMVTGGPWQIDDDEQRIDGIGTVHMYRIVDPKGGVVAEFSNSTCNEIVYEGDGEGGGRHYDYQAMGNATVMAAAPDLYAALVGLMAAVGMPEDGGSDRDAWNDAEAALAKARGERS